MSERSTCSLSSKLLLLGLVLTSAKVVAESADTEYEEVIAVASFEDEVKPEQRGFSVNAVELDELLAFDKDIGQVLKSVPGIVIRTDGSVGSDLNLSINGLSGNQIRYFLDGIPMESFGSALELGDLPVTIAQDIRIYKGVVPIWLSSDALGGAINIITPGSGEDFLVASTSYGSFNTHRLSLNAQEVLEDSSTFVRVSGFHNHSDNDYDVHNVAALDSLGNVEGTRTARRFHDQYTSRMLSLGAGLTDRDWADELSIKITGASNRNNEQHPDFSINRVYGKYHTRNHTRLLSTTYRLETLDYQIVAYALKGRVSESTIDVASRTYDWDGNYEEKDPGIGELSAKTHFILTDAMHSGQFNGRYFVNDDLSIGTSLVINQLERSGRDRVNATNTQFSRQNRIQKHILALDTSYLFGKGQYSINLFAKHYRFDALINVDEVVDGEEQNVRTTPGFSKQGGGLALEMRWNDEWLGRFSFERAYRLPETAEILGDAQYVRPNPDLRSETSNNANIGLDFNYQGQNGTLTVSNNLFYRQARDFIIYNPDQVIRGLYINLNDIRAVGTELSTQYKQPTGFSVRFNLTYQDITDQSRKDRDGEENDNFGSRIPNTPYLFGSSRLGWEQYFSDSSRISAYWNTFYVKEYFLYWEGAGSRDDKNEIPKQITHDVDIEYRDASDAVSVALGITNASDAKVYDNFNIQKPGRGWSLKLSYSY